MSTRGWYDYYVIAPHTGTLSLAMRFYKWGDATPENALDEYLLLRETLSAHDGRLPVEWLDRLLREQLGELHPALPPHFATGAFLFLLQRAAEWIECDRWRRFDPPEERADFPLCWALEEALATEPFEIPPHPDPLLERVRRFIATARYIRPWRNYGLRLTLLGWLQYLTQPTRSADMGSLAGDWDPHWDIAYRYRLFFWIHPNDPFRIERISIELCDPTGSNLLTAADPEDADEWRREELDRLRETIRESDIAMAALETVEHEYAMPADRFWQFRERPDPPETWQRARRKALQPSWNMLLIQAEKRFGAAVAAASRPLMEQIDEFDRLLTLADAVIDSPDSGAWLAALGEAVQRSRPGTDDRTPELVQSEDRGIAVGAARGTAPDEVSGG